MTLSTTLFGLMSVLSGWKVTDDSAATRGEKLQGLSQGLCSVACEGGGTERNVVVMMSYVFLYVLYYGTCTC